MPPAGAFELSRDLRPSDWLRRKTGGFAVGVGSLVPARFPAYARVLHPAYREARPPIAPPTPVTWAEVAKANGKVIHPEVQFGSLADREQPELWDLAPNVGTFPAGSAAHLAAILARYTTTPCDCWFAVWNGWGDLAFRSERAPAFELPGADTYCYVGRSIWLASPWLAMA